MSGENREHGEDRKAPTLQLSDVRAGYTAEDVLRGVGLTVHPGEIVSVLGPSGSGKSTLLRVLAGLHPVRTGSVLIEGRDVTHTPAHKRTIGLVPQDGALFAHYDVAGNVGYGIAGLSARASRRSSRVLELIELVGLAGLERRRPHELSGGQQQRVALARALAREPHLVLMDEPFGALDAALRVRLREEVAAILRARGMATVLVTHDQEEALSLSDRITVLREGLVAQTATPERLYNAPGNAWIADFLGEAVILPVRREGAVAMTPLGPVPIENAEGASRVMIRPEQLELTEGDLGVVTRTRYAGRDSLVFVAVAGIEREIAVRHTGERVGIGTRVGITVRGAGHALFE